MHINSILKFILSAFAVAPVIGQHITTDVYNEGKVDIGGDVAIDPGASWYIYGSSREFFGGNIANSGSFYINLDYTCSALDLAANSNSVIVNSGLIAFRARGSSASYNLNIQRFENSGQIYFITENLPVVIYSIDAPIWKNTKDGSINLYSTKRISQTANLGNIGKAIINDGQICLRNHAWLAIGDVQGEGCIDIGINSVFWYQRGGHQFNSNQTIYLSTKSSTLYVGSKGQDKPYLVAGFGGGNAIALSKMIKSFDYDTTSGILTTVTGSYTMQFNIGMGYDRSQISLVPLRDLGTAIGDSTLYSAITYTGAVPDRSTSTKHCVPCKDLPKFPSRPT